MKKLLLISLVTLLFSCEKSEEPDCGCFEIKEKNQLINNSYPNPWVQIQKKRLTGECFDKKVDSQLSFFYSGDDTIRTNIQCDSWL